ncbi:MAG: hypothetical protein QOI54_894 [Actinomycetota bacterium]|nr:hypothetical protein [Actinomycetota bacterium]
MNRKTATLGLTALLLAAGSSGIALAATGSDSPSPQSSHSSSSRSSQSSGQSSTVAVPTATQSADDGAHHVRHTGVNEPGDDNNRNRHGRRGATPATGVAAAADDNGRHGELEPGDDHGGHGQEPGDDHGGDR